MITDEQLEKLIDTATLRLSLAKGRRARERSWNELKALIARRSPQQVARMEREKGLTKE
jgi:hypothetical protein